MLALEYEFSVMPFGDLANIHIDGNDIVLSYPEYKDGELLGLKEELRLDISEAESVAKGILVAVAAIKEYRKHHDDD